MRYEPHATGWRTSPTAPMSHGGMTEESLVLAACPSAARCSRWLIRVELPRWGLDHLAPTIETLTGDLVDQIVQTIGPVAPPAAWADNEDVPMIRCVLWSDSGLAGVRIWDPTPLVIPRLASVSLYPSVQWGSSRTDPAGKWTWFQLPVTLGRPDPNAPRTVPIPVVPNDTGVQPALGTHGGTTGGFRRLSDPYRGGSTPDQHFGVQLTTN